MKYSTLLFCILLLTVACHHPVPRDVEQVLDKTPNRDAFYSALEHYHTDTLKTNALYFIIRNLYGKGTILYEQRDRKGKAIQHDWSQYNSFDQATSEGQRLGISFRKVHAFADADSLSKDMLIDNIDKAFEAWRRPWARTISFQDFCEYILPYKDRNEPVTVQWRDSIAARFRWVSSVQQDDNLSLAQQINDSLRADFSFNYNYVLAPPFPSLSRLHQLNQGPCPYMSSLTIYTFRGLGIPVARDFVPYWTNIHHFSNHEWNAMLSGDGKWYGFMGCEANPGNYAPKFQAAKVFRETFSNRPNELASLVKDMRYLPEHLQRTNLLDVTDQYYPTADLQLKVPDSLLNEPVLFLAVYNRKKWRPVEWGRVQSGRVTFKNMAKGVIYLPMSVLASGGLRPCMHPVVLDSTGGVYPIELHQGKSESVLVSSFGLGDLGSKDFINPLVPHQQYTLFYWNEDTWQSLSSQVATGSKLLFEGVPSGALLSIGRDDEQTSGEQLFIFDAASNKQIFW